MRKKLVLIGCFIALLVGVGIGYIVYLNFPALTEEKKEENDNTQSTTDAIVVDSEDDGYLYHIKVFSTAIDDEYSAYDIKIDLEYNIYLAKLESVTSTVSEEDYELVATLDDENSIILEEYLSSDLFTHELGTSMDINEFFSYYIVNYNTNKVLYSIDDIDTEVNTLVLSLALGDSSYFDETLIEQEYLDLYEELSFDGWYGFYYYLTSEESYISYDMVDNRWRLAITFNYLDSFQSDKIEYFDDYEYASVKSYEYNGEYYEYDVWLTSSILKQDFEDAYHKLFGSDKTVEYEEFEPNGCDICNLEDDSITCYWNGSCGGDTVDYYRIFNYDSYRLDGDTLYMYINYVDVDGDIYSYGYDDEFWFRMYEDDIVYLKLTFNSEEGNYYWVSSEYV